MSKLKFTLADLQSYGARLTCDGAELFKRNKGRAENVSHAILDVPLTGAIGMFSDWTMDTGKGAVAFEGLPQNTRETFQDAKRPSALHPQGAEWIGRDPEHYTRAQFADFTESHASAVLAANIDFSEMETAIAAIHPKRRRTFSEYDGEFLEHRRNEIAPFASTVRMRGETRVLRLTAQIGALGNVSGTEIDAFGAAVAAIVNRLEGAGILVDLTVLSAATNVDKAESMRLDVHVKVKEAGEYLAPGQLALTCSTAFFRRVIWTLRALTCVAIGKDISDGKGRTVNAPEHEVTADGITLHLHKFRQVKDAFGFEVAVMNAARFILENAIQTRESAA